jgi:hypothetical protein
MALAICARILKGFTTIFAGNEGRRGGRDDVYLYLLRNIIGLTS